MSVTFKMIAPGFQAGMNVTSAGGTSYTSDVNGVVTANAADVQSLQLAGFVVFPERTVVTLGSSGSVIPGAINIVPSTAASSVVYAYTLGVPVAGTLTTILAPSGSTAAVTITSTGANINLTNTNATVLTFTAAGSVDLLAVGSTLYQITQRTPTQSSAGAATVFQPASS